MRQRGPILLLVGFLVVLAFGLLTLFQLRFEAGDVYPPYSSLRADPLGCMALYESLADLPGLNVSRDFSANNRLPETRNTAYLHLGAHSFDWLELPEDLFKETEAFVLRGGRLVIAFHPEPVRPFRFLARSAGTNAPPAARKGPRQQPQPEAEDDGRNYISLHVRWGVQLAHLPLQKDGDTYSPVTAERQADLPLPPELAWHTGLVFTNLDTTWRVIYSRQAKPVLVEKAFGAGAIVMLSDSFFLSNEGLREDPQVELLSWLVSPATRVVFDEAHHGIISQPGVAGLARKYRLHGLAAALLVLAALFIWKNSLPLAPTLPSALPDGFVAGKEASAGFVNLLRRNIPERDLLRLCFQQWTDSLAAGKPHLINRVDRAQAVLEAPDGRATRDPVSAYREICEVLRTTKSPRPPGPEDKTPPGLT